MGAEGFSEGDSARVGRISGDWDVLLMAVDGRWSCSGGFRNWELVLDLTLVEKEAEE